MTALLILGCAVLVSGAVFAHALIVAYRTPAEREPDAVEQTARFGLVTYDQQALATALLRPDDPALPDERFRSLRTFQES